MLKHIVALLVISVLIILGMSYAQDALKLILSGHDWVAETLTQVFSGGETGDIIRKLIALLAIPVVVGLIPGVIYWVTKRRWFPYFMELVWVVWLIQTSALVILYKAAA